MGYVGSAPAGVQLTGSDAVFVFTASGGETSVTTADSGASVVYEPGFVSVFVNGVRFVEGDDFTASTGSGVSLSNALNGGDVVVVVASDSRPLDDAVPRSGGSFAGSVDFLGGITSNGETVYHRGNVVGTVSESGGTPTGAVVERDSNANGEYVKFADGTMICFREIDESYGAATEVGGIFVSNEKSSDYPVNFVGTVVGSAGQTDTEDAGFWLMGRGNNGSGGWRSQLFRASDFSTGNAGFVELIAIGRWY